MPSGEEKSPSVICQYTHLSEQLLSHMRRLRESVILLISPLSFFSFKGEYHGHIPQGTLQAELHFHKAATVGVL